MAATPVAVPATRGTFFNKERGLWLAIANTQSKSKQTAAMAALVKRLATRLGGAVTTDDGNVYVRKGEPGEGAGFPCIVAHLDTVHAVIPQAHYEVIRDPNGDWVAVDRSTEHTDEKTGKQVVYYAGIGGDDKCGIYLALNALRVFPCIKLAFFRDEEIGCLGAERAQMEFFDDATLVLQGDRRGNGDFVDRIGGDLQSTGFRAAVKPLLAKHGYKTASGAPTDVGTLKENGLKVSAANMSCGYVDPHCSRERVVEADLLRAQHLMYDVVATLGGQTWAHEQEKRAWRGNDDWGGGYHYGHWAGLTKYETDQLAATGFVEDADGAWSLPVATEAALVAQLAEHPDWTASKPCPYCGYAWPQWERGRHVCTVSPYRIAQGTPAATGCGRTMPMPASTLADRKRTAERINAERAAERTRDAAKAAKLAEWKTRHPSRSGKITYVSRNGVMVCNACGGAMATHPNDGCVPVPPAATAPSFRVGDRVVWRAVPTWTGTVTRVEPGRDGPYLDVTIDNGSIVSAPAERFVDAFEGPLLRLGDVVRRKSEANGADGIVTALAQSGAHGWLATVDWGSGNKTTGSEELYAIVHLADATAPAIALPAPAIPDPPVPGRPRPLACFNCGSPGTKTRWNPLGDGWVCGVCYAYDNETPAGYARRRAVLMFGSLVDGGDVPSDVLPGDKEATIDLIVAWLNEGRTEKEIMAEVPTLFAGPDDAGDFADADGGTWPTGCASCQSTAIAYDGDEDAWLCRNCDRWSYVSATGRTVDAGTTRRQYAFLD